MWIGHSPRSLQVARVPRQDSNLRHLFGRPVIHARADLLSTLNRIPLRKPILATR